MRRMDEFLKQANTKEFITALEEDKTLMRNSAHGYYQLVIRVKSNTQSDGTRMMEKLDQMRNFAQPDNQ